VATLLLVDDDLVVRELLYDVLSGNFECHTAERPEQALEYLEAESYDVVLTDISMPSLGGLEIIKRITQRNPTTPVIIISGRPVADQEEFIRAGAFAFLYEAVSVGGNRRCGRSGNQSSAAAHPGAEC